MTDTKFYQIECSAFTYKTIADKVQKISDQMKEKGYVFKDMYPIGPNFWCYILVFCKENSDDN